MNLKVTVRIQKQKKTATTRFNLFKGYQTLNQREQSFKVIASSFDLSMRMEVLQYDNIKYRQKLHANLQKCSFYLCIWWCRRSLQKGCYVAFWDEVTLATQEQQGRIVNEDRFIGKWYIVIVKNLPFRDQRLNGKIPKTQSLRDPLGVFETLLWRSKSVYAEEKVVVKLNYELEVF